MSLRKLEKMIRDAERSGDFQDADNALFQWFDAYSIIKARNEAYKRVQKRRG